MKKWFFGLMLLTSLPLMAGNGSSGGGNIFGDQLNPWFLQNTKTVKYCVEIDPQFSNLNKSEVVRLIESSLSYWKRTFANYSGNFQHDFKFDVKLATQDFLLTDCDNTTDLKFQMGFLTEDQKKELPNFKQLIGLAYRTHYDEVNLKAKGFIYVAPEAGQFRPNSPLMHNLPWSHGKHVGLELIITHELGHIFGLQDDHYSNSGLMNAKFAEQITTKASINYFGSAPRKEIPSPFGCNKSFDGDHEVEIEYVDIPGSEAKMINQDIRTELGLPSKFKARFLTSNYLMQILVDGKNFAEINLNQFGELSGGLSGPAITVYLTKKQNVYKNLPARAFNNHLLAYHLERDVVKKGEELKLKDGRNFKVFVKYDQSCLPSIGMIYQDEVFMDVFAGL